MKRHLLPFLITLLGFLQIGGYYLNSPLVYHLGMTYVASPFPRVLAGVRGEDTFRRRFVIELLDGADQVQRIISPKELSEGLKGPSSRRIAFRILFTFFDGENRDSPVEAIRYAFCEPAPVLSELEITDSAAVVRITSWEEGRREETEIVSRIECSS